MTFILSVTCQLTHAAEYYEWEINYNLEDFTIEESNGLVKIHPNPVLMMNQYLDYNIPAIPQFYYTIMKYPRGTSIPEVEFDKSSNGKIIIAENVEIATSYPVDSESGKLIRNGWIRYPFREYYPTDSEKVKASSDCYGLTLMIMPFEYDPETRTLYFTPNINVKYKISPMESLRENELIITKPEYPDSSEIKHRTIHDFTNPKPLLYGGEYHLNLEASSKDPIDYLIITSASLAPTYERLLDWKWRKGLRTKIVTVGEIDLTYEAPTRQERIKQCIAQYNNENDLKYVLLGGETNLIPSPPCYGKANFSDGIKEDYTIPTDLYYACLDGRFDWDSNQNGIYGEITDGIDLNQNVIVTRVPLSVQSQVSNFIDKVIDYEKMPK